MTGINIAMFLHGNKSKQLIESLRDPNGHVRLDAVRALGEMKDPGAVEALIEALNDREDYVRWNTAEALGKILDTRSLTPLINALEDEHPLVRKEAFKALGLFTDQRARDAVKSCETDKVHITLRALASNAPDALSRVDAIRFLQQSRDARAIDPLIAILTDKRIDPAEVGLQDDAVVVAADALGDVKDPRSVGALSEVVIAHLRNENILREASKYGFGPATIEWHVSRDDTNDGFRGREQIAAWWQSLPRRYLDAYRRQAVCNSRAIACVQALAKISNESKTLDLFVDCLSDGNAILREAAIRGLVLISERTNSWEWLAKSASGEVLGIVGKRAIKPLIAMLIHRESDIRRGSALALGHFDEPEVLAALFRARKDDDAQVRAAAATAIVEICSRSPGPVINILDNPDSDMKWAAAKALGRARIADATESLIRLLRDEHSNVRSVAAKALGQICDGKAIEPLTEAAADRDENVRREAVKSIDKIVGVLDAGSSDAIEHFTRLLKDQRANLRSVAAKALGQLIATQAVEPLTQAATDVDENVRRDVIQALDKIVKAIKSEIDKAQRAYDALLEKRESMIFNVRTKWGVEAAHETLLKWHSNIPAALKDWVEDISSLKTAIEYELQKMTATALLKAAMKKDIKMRIYLDRFAQLNFRTDIEGLPIDRKINTDTTITFEIEGEQVKEFTDFHEGIAIEVIFKSAEMKTQQAKIVMLQERLTLINALTSRVFQLPSMDGSA